MGIESKNILFLSGSAKKIVELQKMFNSGAYFGKNVNWDEYTVYDAASLVLWYLKTLPEPVIPYDQYELYVSCLDSKDDKNESHLAKISAF